MVEEIIIPDAGQVLLYGTEFCVEDRDDGDAEGPIMGYITVDAVIDGLNKYHRTDEFVTVTENGIVIGKINERLYLVGQPIDLDQKLDPISQIKTVHSYWDAGGNQRFHDPEGFALYGTFGLANLDGIMFTVDDVSVGDLGSQDYKTRTDSALRTVIAMNMLEQCISHGVPPSELMGGMGKNPYDVLIKEMGQK